MRELDYEKVGMRICQTRKKKGWSQDELANQCGMSVSSVEQIERGTSILNLDKLVNLCKVLDIGADELLWGMMHISNAVPEMWNNLERKKKTDERKTGADLDGRKIDSDANLNRRKADSYVMYVKIMKSVAEIMNER